MTYLRKCQPDQFKHLRYVLTGAEKMRPELAQSFEKKFRHCSARRVRRYRDGPRDLCQPA